MKEWIFQEEQVIRADGASVAVGLRPMAELVRCKNCKHSECWYKDKYRCFLWNENGIDVFENGFCNYGDSKQT